MFLQASNNLSPGILLHNSDTESEFFGEDKSAIHCTPYMLMNAGYAHTIALRVVPPVPFCSVPRNTFETHFQD